jgi:hypothetical protein
LNGDVKKMSEADKYEPAAAGHESSAINTRSIVWSGVGLTAVIVVSFALMWQLMIVLTREEALPVVEETFQPEHATQTSRLAGAPLLDADQTVALRQLRERERAMLDEYEWLDQQAGIARIPVVRAMEIISTNGLPQTGSTAASAGGETE